MLAGAGDQSAAGVVELVLVTAEDIGTHASVPAATACELGFISAEERDGLVHEADARNRAQIGSALRRASRRDATDRAALAATASDVEAFASLARRLRLQCTFIEPSWPWQVSSLAAALAGGAGTARLRWLATATCGTRGWALERSMRQAADRAFWLGAPATTEM